ncbi:MAG: hypothetical protein WB683_19760 [Candidatus Sulfotelmatobacter sp.]
MFRPMHFRAMRTVVFGIAVAISGLAARAQQTDSSQDKHLDIQSSVGDLHMGTDADARKAGLPLYPGARLHRDEDNDKGVNFGVVTEAFGMKLVVVKYDSDDAPGKVIGFYRNKLKKYGKVIECHTSESGGAHAEINDDEHSKELKCDRDNTGPVTELKVGTEDNQHVVAIQPSDGRSGSTFALVYVHTRGKQADL